MAHKTLINGVAYEVDSGTDNINGTVYEKDYGEVLIDSTVHTIEFIPPLSVSIMSTTITSTNIKICLYYMSGSNKVELSQSGIYEVSPGTKIYASIEYSGPVPPIYNANVNLKSLGSTAATMVASGNVLPDTPFIYEFILGTNIEVTMTSILYGTSSGLATISIVETEQPKAYMESISIVSPPSKTVYAAGGKPFDPTGMVVNANYVNGTTAEITDYTIIDEGPFTVDRTSVQISYTEMGKTCTTSYNVSLVNSGVLPDGEIADSWSVIKAKTNIGSYAIGNTKPIWLSTGNMVDMEIIAFGLDVTPSGSTAAITWLANKYVNSMKMNSSKTAEIDWSTCDVRAYVQGEFYNSLPTDVKDAIVTVTKTYYTPNNDATLTSNDNIWIPSQRELFGGTSFNATIGNHESYGVVYSERFPDVESRKSINGWTRTRRQNYKDTKYFGSMSSGGCSSRYLSMNDLVTPGFCT